MSADVRPRGIPGLLEGEQLQTVVTRRLPAGALVLICTALSVAAFGARSVWVLGVLSAFDVGLALLLCPRRARLGRQAAQLLAWQTAVIVGLYLLRFGAEGAAPGLRTSWQLFLAFLPGMVLLRSLPPSRLVQALNAVLPYRAAFVLATSIRFIPLVLREVRSIHEVQILRGARVLPRDLVRPWNWPDLVHCVLVPAVIQSLMLATQISLAARARAFGARDRRTYWPGP